MAFLHQSHTNILYFSTKKSSIYIYIYLTLDNVRLTLFSPSFYRKFSFAILEAFLEIICLFSYSEILPFVLLPRFYLIFDQEISDRYINSRLQMRAFFVLGRKFQESAAMSEMICGNLKAPILIHGYRTRAKNAREQSEFSTHQCFQKRILPQL